MDGFFPQEVFSILGIGITNTVVSTWIMMVIITAVVLLLRRLAPSALEMAIEGLSGMLADLMKRPVEPYLPFLGALVLFIGFANILSVLPYLPLPNGKMIAIISPTRDINTPAALAITVFFAVHYFGVQSQGAWDYFKDLASPIYLLPLTLPLEIFGQLSRTLSLAVRLFGNIISLDMVVAVIFMLVPLIAPLPLTGLNVFTGVLQAYIFTSLAAVFISQGLEDIEAE
jgi:F-type H+-transporting ATPase subunit a